MEEKETEPQSQADLSLQQERGSHGSLSQCQLGEFYLIIERPVEEKEIN